MKQITTLYRLSLALLLAASVAACGTDSSSSGGSSNSGASGFSLRVTDAPFSEVERLEITFREVRLRKADDSWVVIPAEKLANATIEIAGLQGTKTANLLENVDVPEGDYTELRLMVEDIAKIELSAGGTEDLEIPSGASSGLKIKGDFSVIDSMPTIMIVDFDLLRSVNRFGPLMAPKYKMNPVLRLIKGNGFGHARGTVDPELLKDTTVGCSDDDPLTDNAVYVFKGDVVPDDISKRNNDVDPITTSRITMDPSSGDFIYEAAFLPAGDYTIAFTCNASAEDLKEDDDDLKFFGTRKITIKVNDTLFL